MQQHRTGSKQGQGNPNTTHLPHKELAVVGIAGVVVLNKGLEGWDVNVQAYVVQCLGHVGARLVCVMLKWQTEARKQCRHTGVLSGSPVQSTRGQCNGNQHS